MNIFLCVRLLFITITLIVGLACVVKAFKHRNTDVGNTATKNAILLVIVAFTLYFSKDMTF